MRRLLGTFLYGSRHGSNRLLETREWQPPMLWLLAFIAVFAIRLALPFRPCESQDVYDAITWALRHQQNWGKQALAGVFQYSPLPAVAQLLLSPLRFLPALGLSAGAVLTALAQTWVLFLFVRTARLYFPLTVSAFVGSVLFFAVMLAQSIVAGGYWLVCDPFWLCAVPVAVVIYRTARWEQQGVLRDLVYAALAAGVLVFGGLTGFLFAVNIILVLIVRGRSRPDQPRIPVLLVLLPFIYTVALFFVFNQLVMNDSLFAVRRLFEYGEAVDFWSACLRDANLLWVTVLLVVPLLVLIVKPIPLGFRMGWHLGSAVALGHLLQAGSQAFMGGLYLLAAIALLPLVLHLVSLPRLPRPLPQIVPALVGLVLAFGILHLRQDALDYESFADDGAPPRAELVDLVDQHWQGSRILIYGLRPAVMYAVPETADEEPGKRFVARLDFNQNVLREEIEREQLHLLVPPDDGRYYPPHHRIFSEVHSEGVPEWLLLEQVWPSANGSRNGQWQLWRCIRKRPDIPEQVRTSAP